MRLATAWLVVAACSSSSASDKAGDGKRDLFVDPAAKDADLLAAAYANPKWNESRDLKLDVPAGWTATYDMKSWGLVRTRRTPQETDRGAFSIAIVMPNVPRSADALVKHWLSWRDPGVQAPITRTEPLDGGVLVEFDEKIPGDPERRFDFIAVRTLGDRILKCESVFFRDADERTIAEKICKTARR